MLFNTHLREVMLTFPYLYEMPIQVYNHIFLTIGNGYEWKEGELVYEGELYDTEKEAVLAVLEDYSNKMKQLLIDQDSSKRDVLSDHYLSISKKCVNRIYNVTLLAPYLSDPILDFPDNSDFHFSPLSKYSAIANIPDNLAYSWLRAIEDLIDVLEDNRDKFTDPDNLFESVKDRVKYIRYKYDTHQMPVYLTL